jgi:hypothetical protein
VWEAYLNDSVPLAVDNLCAYVEGNEDLSEAKGGTREGKGRNRFLHVRTLRDRRRRRRAKERGAPSVTTPAGGYDLGDLASEIKTSLSHLPDERLGAARREQELLSQLAN